jgi:translation initiation factor IF-2
MPLKLIQIVKELNVGLSTLVEHLAKKGYEVENKPTAKITDQMYSELLKEFQKSGDIKQQAKSVSFGAGKTGKEEHEVTAAEVPKVVVTPIAEEKPERPEGAIQFQRPTVLGKIDLSSRLQQRTKEKEKSEVVAPVAAKAPAKPAEIPANPPASIEPEAKVKTEVPKVTPKPPVEKEKKSSAADKTVVNSLLNTPVKPDVTDAKVTPTPDSEDGKMMRAETPELRGLKILGKIDTNAFDRNRGRSKPATPPPAAAKPAAPGSNPPAAGAKPATPGSPESEEARRKRKRKRKKVAGEGTPNTQNTGQSQGSNQGSNANQGQGQSQGANNNQQNNSNNNNPQNRPNTGGQGGQNYQGQSGAQQRRPSPGNNNTGPNNRPPANRPATGREEPKEVSKKEIEDKIKATMARLSGGGKNKRQKFQRDKRDRFREKQEQLDQDELTGKLELTEFISAQELSNLLDVPISEVITVCMNLGVIVSINQRLDAEIIELVAGEFGREVEFISVEEQADEEVIVVEDDPALLIHRAPIVTVMGHVDHGKTSLLDYIRSANVVSGEAGGITQHIGAYEMIIGDNKKITFLDTPGHEAFTAMRARGAKVTDIAIIIIAADDSIMPQTKEAISHAQAANVPIIFAINKVDKVGAQPEKIKQELASMNLLVEEWGGKYQSQDISAKTGLGIPEILEKILLEAEMLELKANPNRSAVGTVIEASLDKGRGYVTKLLVQYGTLRDKDSLVAGEFAGKVKALLNERGQRIKSAGPSTPVLVLGLTGAPQAGDRFKVVDSDQEARQIASKRAQITREQTTRATKRISLDEIGRRLALGNFKELKLIVKGDVDGSIEALADSLIKLSIEKVQVNVIHKAVGGIIESDVLLASASDAIIIGFQVRPSSGARKLAEKEGVEIKTYSIIYEAIEEVKAAIEGMLEPTKVETVIGMVEIREIYKISKIGTIAGCYVQEGKISRNSHIRLVRDGIIVFPTRENTHGEVSSLKRFKDDVKEVRNGMECGLSIKNFNEMRVGDIIEVYEITEVKQRLD